MRVIVIALVMLTGLAIGSPADASTRHGYSHSGGHHHSYGHHAYGSGKR